MYFSGNVKLPYINFQRETLKELMVLYSVLKVHPQTPIQLRSPNYVNLGTQEFLITARLVNLKGHSRSFKAQHQAFYTRLLNDKGGGSASSQLGQSLLVESRVLGRQRQKRAGVPTAAHSSGSVTQYSAIFESCTGGGELL